MKKKAVKFYRRVPNVRLAKPSRFDEVAQETEGSYLNSDSRVIVRQRDVVRFELAATDEHLAGLKASLAEVQAKRERLAARVEGLSRVLKRRAGC